MIPTDNVLRPLFLGLDIGATESHYALTRDGANFEQGTLTLEQFPAFLQEHELHAVGCEYTGRLAEPWILAASDKGTRAWYLHSVERKALTRLNRQRTKTDKRDSKTIARSLYIYLTAELNKAFGAEYELFTEAAAVKTAWTLRGLISAVDKIVEQRKGCNNRALTARRVGHEATAQIWENIATSFINSEDTALTAVKDFAREKFPREYELLLTIPGIGDRTATYLLATLMPADRFPDVKHVLAYVGLDTRDYITGDKAQRRSRMSKRGNPRLRGMLFLAAKVNMAHNSDNTFKRFMNRQIMNGHRPKEALYMTSDRILRTAWRMLITGQPYRDPLNPPPPPAPIMPSNLISQSDYARMVGKSRQAISQQVKANKLLTEEWQGKTYIVHEGSQP